MNASILTSVKTLKNGFIRQDIIRSSQITNHLEKVWFLDDETKKKIKGRIIENEIQEDIIELSINGGKLIIEPYYPRIYCPYCNNNPFELDQHENMSSIELETNWKNKGISSCRHEIYIGGIVQRFGQNALKRFLEAYQDFVPELIQLGTRKHLTKTYSLFLEGINSEKKAIILCTSNEPVEDIIELLAFSPINLFLTKEELQYTLIKRYLTKKSADLTFVSDIMHKSVGEVRIIDKIVQGKVRLIYDILKELAT